MQVTVPAVIAGEVREDALSSLAFVSEWLEQAADRKYHETAEQQAEAIHDAKERIDGLVAFIDALGDGHGDAVVTDGRRLRSCCCYVLRNISDECGVDEETLDLEQLDVAIGRLVAVRDVLAAIDRAER